ncbi:MAG TPA: MotA/TolQ/ExbB proton channel family protein [Myxococcota bacterium]|nr:MotA/TolQ/ExbB proton channel family protein [Myxococcota bacterium]HNH46701.1 MotA/TolQ/ExbB proton channel family protein [Myxococcota bacterium]
MTLLDLFADMFEEGGFFMYPITVCAVIGMALALERFVYLFLRASLNASAFMSQLQRELLAGKVEDALKLCNAEPSAAIARVMKAGLVRAGRPEAELKAAVEEQVLEVQPQISRRLAYLPMLANVATLLGLLGTIQGLIFSFHAVSAADASARSTALADGIAVAMYTTFWGLLVAIPILVVHSLLAARANQIMDEVDHYALKLTNLLSTTAGVDLRRDLPPTA